MVMAVVTKMTLMAVMTVKAMKMVMGRIQYGLW